MLELFGIPLPFASLALAGGAIAVTYAKKRIREREEDAQLWARSHEIQQWGLLPGLKLDDNGWPVPGFVLGQLPDGTPIIDLTTPDTSRHALVSAPTGTGKTWSVFFPTLTFGWTHSAVVHDRKGEFFKRTAPWRTRFSRIIQFSPTSMQSACYNPFDMVRWQGEDAIRDAQNLVEYLPNSIGNEEGGASVWDEAAKDFATAAILFLLCHAPPEAKNFAGLRRALSEGRKLAEAMLLNEHPHPHVRMEIANAARSLYGNPSERYVGSVEGTLRSYLRVYQETKLATITAKSDFTPSDLMCADQPVTLYLRLPPSDDKRLMPFTRLFMSQIFDALMPEDEDVDRDGKPKRWQLAWVLDEFWRMGKIDAIEGALADMRSYGMRALLGVQGLNQIIDHYGLHNSILNNCRWITARQNGYTECVNVANMLGQNESRKQGRSTSYGILGEPKGWSVSESLQWQPVIQAAHINRIPKDRLIVFGEEKPIRACRTEPKLWQRLGAIPGPTSLPNGNLLLSTSIRTQSNEPMKEPDTSAANSLRALAPPKRKRKRL